VVLTAGKERIPGCWVTDGITIYAVWLDGDVGVIPATEVGRPSSKPSKSST
jgi:hypothetical protein